MKIRTDFVTNSSSSNFTVEISINYKNGRVSFYEDPYYSDPDCGGYAFFSADLRNINKHLSSVEKLATWLANSVKGGRNDKAFKLKKAEFINKAKTEIKSVRDIESIVVERNYEAWGGIC